ncbi:MAG: sterol desaturase family protein [Myxococcales bacterium]|nr:sterol desaturase family protein [Myxococcales bacterium]
MRAAPVPYVLLMLTVPTALVLWAFERGVDPTVATAVVIFGSIPVVLAAERLWPHERSWNRSHGDLRTDAAYVFLVSPVLGAFLTILLSSIFLGRLDPLRQADGAGLWPHEWPLLLQALMVGVITEFGQYWWHRLCHTRPFLWRFHAVHHSSARLYSLNAFRFHPADAVVGYIFMYAPIFALGANQEAIGIFTVFDFVFGLIQHGNVNVRMGPLNWLFSGPELHYWHHSKVVKNTQHNYGSTFILWDVAFGTRMLPKDRVHDPSDIGFEGMERFPRGLGAQFLSIFRWRRLGLGGD